MKKITLVLFMILAMLFVSASMQQHYVEAAEVPSRTTLQDEDLQMLEIDNGTFFYSKVKGTVTGRYTPTSDYTLEDVTDIAFRIAASYRHNNTVVPGNALIYFSVKFKDDSKIYGIKKDGQKYTYLTIDDKIEEVTVTNGGNNQVGGQISLAPGQDGTLYVPIGQMCDGNMTNNFGTCLSEIANWQNKIIEYIDITASSYRWDIIVGDIALVKRTPEVSYEIMNFTKAATDANVELLSAFYDNVKLVVNGTEATKDDDGLYSVNFDYGKVYITSDKLRYWDSIKLKAELDGYGITNVLTVIENYPNQTKNPFNSGYTYEGEYKFRTIYLDENGENTSVVGTNPLNLVLNVTVEKLVKLSVDNNAATISYGDLDTSVDDGFIYLASNQESIINVIPAADFDFTGVELNDVILTEDSKTVDNETGKILSAIYKINLSEDSTLKILGLGEETEVTVLFNEGGSVKINNEDISNEDVINTNIYKVLVIEVNEDAGYSSKVVVEYALDDEEATVIELSKQEDGKYYYQVDGEFTIKVTFTVNEYTITYRLNGGVYANESNPTIITYFDTVTLIPVSKEGYRFLGWRLEGSDEYITELSEVDSDITIIAVFELLDNNDDNPDDDPGDTPDDDPDDTPDNPDDEEDEQPKVNQTALIIAIVSIISIGAIVGVVFLLKKMRK